MPRTGVCTYLFGRWNGWMLRFWDGVPARTKGQAWTLSSGFEEGLGNSGVDRPAQALVGLWSLR